MNTVEDVTVAEKVAITPARAENLSREIPVDPPPFSILFLYEDVETARRATATSFKLSRGLNPGNGMDLHVWRIDLLQYPTHRAAALNDAAKADAVIVSSHRPVSKNIDSWLDECIATKRETGLIMVQIAANGEDWSLSIRHPRNFSGAAEGGLPSIEETVSCGYRAAPPGGRQL